MIVESNREKEHVSVDIYRRARGQEVDHHALGDCFESVCVVVCMCVQFGIEEAELGCGIDIDGKIQTRI